MSDVTMSDKARTILRAASRVFLEHGYAAATTDRIQQESGVSKSTIYAHFSNKEALFSAVIRYEQEGLLENLLKIDFAAEDFEAVLKKVALEYLKIFIYQEKMELLRAMIAEAPRMPELAHMFYEVAPAAVCRLMEDCLVKAEQAGRIETSGLTHYELAKVFVGLIRSEPLVYYLLHPHENRSSEHLEGWIDTVIRTFLLAFGQRIR